MKRKDNARKEKRRKLYNNVHVKATDLVHSCIDGIKGMAFKEYYHWRCFTVIIKILSSRIRPRQLPNTIKIQKNIDGLLIHLWNDLLHKKLRCRLSAISRLYLSLANDPFLSIITPLSNPFTTILSYHTTVETWVSLTLSLQYFTIVLCDLRARKSLLSSPRPSFENQREATHQAPQRGPLTEHHTEARFHRGNEVVESFHELVEKQEEHRHEGEEAEEEGHEETAQIIPALFQSGGENTCVTSRRENDYFLTSEIWGGGRKVNLKKGFIYSYLIY